MPWKGAAGGEVPGRFPAKNAGCCAKLAISGRNCCQGRVILHI